MQAEKYLSIETQGVQVQYPENGFFEIFKPKYVTKVK